MGRVAPAPPVGNPCIPFHLQTGMMVARRTVALTAYFEIVR
jgi:hypothetical protein